MFKKIHEKVAMLKEGTITAGQFNQTLQSYLGYLLHANSFKLSQKLKNQARFWSIG